MQRRQTVTDAERFRSAAELSAGAGPAPEEVLVEGRRVVMPEQRVVLPCSERLRYGSQKMGYHGGGAPQEVLVPFGVFRSAGDSEPVAGWQEVPRREPDWWLLDGETAVTSKTRSSSAAPAGVEAAPSPARSPARTLA